MENLLWHAMRKKKKKISGTALRNKRYIKINLEFPKNFVWEVVYNLNLIRPSMGRVQT